jgi:hypothetical protein
VRTPFPGDDMSEQNQPADKGDFITRLVEKGTVELAQRTPRRTMLSKLSSLFLAVLGVSILPDLPLDRRSTVEASTTCSAWQLCGLSGNICDYCGGTTLPVGVGTCGSCPTGYPLGSGFWTMSCGGCLFEYRDCCGAAPRGCGPFCKRGGREPAWCSGHQFRFYHCSVVCQVSCG